MIDRLETVRAIHGTPTLVVLAVTGGGNAVITDLLDVPGASRTVLEVRVPYAAAALDELVGAPVEAAVGETTAIAMADANLRRASSLTDGGADIAGVACTAALVSDRPKRGDHRAHIAAATPHRRRTWEIRLDKGDLDRRGEDRAVADLVLEAMAWACGSDLVR